MGWLEPTKLPAPSSPLLLPLSLPLTPFWAPLTSSFSAGQFSLLLWAWGRRWPSWTLELLLGSQFRSHKEVNILSHIPGEDSHWPALGQVVSPGLVSCDQGRGGHEAPTWLPGPTGWFGKASSQGRWDDSQLCAHPQGVCRRRYLNKWEESFTQVGKCGGTLIAENMVMIKLLHYCIIV